MPYDAFEHRHRFAVWAGARAAQRGFTTVENLRRALEQTSIRAFLESAESQNVGVEGFNEKHREWCDSIVRYLSDLEIKNATYGRAAKLVAVYLKTMVVILPDNKSALKSVAHPPIDRILLRNLSNSDEVNSPHKVMWRTINWTLLDEASYFALLSQLRTAIAETDPWWMLEKHWTITKENDDVL